MFSKFKKEFLVVSLLLSTLTAIFANKFFVRSFELSVANIGVLECTDDRVVGGASEASAEISDDVFRFSYRINRAAYENAYSSLVLIPGKEFKSNLSWVDRVEIAIRSNKPEGAQVLLHVRNFEPGISTFEDMTSLKYNETHLDVSNELTTITVKRDEFLVPTWWRQKYDVKGDAIYPSFDNVSSFDFNVNSRAGTGEIDVASVRCVGTWINSATLNQCLLWMWMGGTLLGIAIRMLGLEKRLNDESASASQLLAHNNLLITESATYQELARRDPLTGLFNRYGLEAELEELSSKYYFDYTMLLFDLDKFKEINDNLGHTYGDRVLFDVATIVRSKLGDSDIVARWGGDEFLVILNNRTVKQASDFAEEIRQSILASDLIYSCSFGIGKSEIDSNFESIFSKADAALYDSKNGGRNKVSSYRKKGGRRAVDHDTAAVPEITLLPSNLPAGEFTIFE